MELGIVKISYDEFKKVLAAAKARGGCGGSRQEFFACDKLEPGECVGFVYDTIENYKHAKTWAIQFCSRRNSKKGSLYVYEQASDYEKKTVYVAKRFKEEN